MPKAEKNVLFSQEDMMKLLDSCYEKCLYGVTTVSPSVEGMAGDYLKKHRKKKPVRLCCVIRLQNVQLPVL